MLEIDACIHFRKKFPIEQKFLKNYASGARKTRISLSDVSDVSYPTYVKMALELIILEGNTSKTLGWYPHIAI